MPKSMLQAIFCVILLAHAPFAHASLEVSLTVTGDIGEIKALLDYIEARNQQGADASDNPMKIMVHSVADGLEMTAQPARVPVKLATPQISSGKLTPGQSTLVTVAVRDEQQLLDTLAIQIVNTNLSTDMYDDGSHGDAKANDGVWSVTLTPLETTPAGSYELIVSGFDRNGHALLSPDGAGEEQPLQARTSVSIER